MSMTPDLRAAMLLEMAQKEGFTTHPENQNSQVERDKTQLAQREGLSLRALAQGLVTKGEFKYINAALSHLRRLKKAEKERLKAETQAKAPQLPKEPKEKAIKTVLKAKERETKAPCVRKNRRKLREEKDRSAPSLLFNGDAKAIFNLAKALKKRGGRFSPRMLLCNIETAKTGQKTGNSSAAVYLTKAVLNADDRKSPEIAFQAGNIFLAHSETLARNSKSTMARRYKNEGINLLLRSASHPEWTIPSVSLIAESFLKSGHPEEALRVIDKLPPETAANLGPILPVLQLAFAAASDDIEGCQRAIEKAPSLTFRAITPTNYQPQKNMPHYHGFEAYDPETQKSYPLWGPGISHLSYLLTLTQALIKTGRRQEALGLAGAFPPITKEVHSAYRRPSVDFLILAATGHAEVAQESLKVAPHLLMSEVSQSLMYVESALRIKRQLPEAFELLARLSDLTPKLESPREIDARIRSILAQKWRRPPLHETDGIHRPVVMKTPAEIARGRADNIRQREERDARRPHLPAKGRSGGPRLARA